MFASSHARSVHLEVTHSLGTDSWLSWHLFVSEPAREPSAYSKRQWREFRRC